SVTSWCSRLSRPTRRTPMPRNPMRPRGGPSGSPARLQVEVVTSTRVRTPGLAAWLASAAPARARGAVTVAITTDRRVRALNRQFRATDQATDVLSFPSDEPAGADVIHLGDVVIAAGVAARQACAAGHP